MLVNNLRLEKQMIYICKSCYYYIRNVENICIHNLWYMQDRNTYNFSNRLRQCFDISYSPPPSLSLSFSDNHPRSSVELCFVSDHAQSQSIKHHICSSCVGIEYNLNHCTASVSYIQRTAWNNTIVSKCSDPKVYTNEITAIWDWLTFEVVRVIEWKETIQSIRSMAV